jgi:5-amino-6-(5-phosphoribosylamino)uracil reductase
VTLEQRPTPLTVVRREPPSWRPFVSLNVAESADGKLAPVDGGKVSFGSGEDRAQMEALRAVADAVLIGGGTLRAEDPPLLIRDPAVRERRIAAKGAPHPRNISVCSVLPARLAEMRFFLHPETDKYVFTTDQSAPALRATAAQWAHVEVVPCDSGGRVDLTEVARRLPALGVRYLLLEGGGELNFSMLEADLVDDVYLTVCPFLFGGRTAPTPVDGAGFPRDRLRKLALESHRVGSQGEVFLHYEVLPDAPCVTPSQLFPYGYDVR